MTDFDSMPAGEEMDMLIAWQVFRQGDFNHLPTVWEEGNTPDGKDGWSGFVCPRCRRTGTDLTHPCVQNYSANIAKAWEVVEHIKGNGSYVGINTKEGVFAVTILKYEGEIARIAHGTGLAPLAICRAALKFFSLPD